MLTDRGSESCERHEYELYAVEDIDHSRTSAELEIRGRSAVALRRQFGCDETFHDLESPAFRHPLSAL